MIVLNIFIRDEPYPGNLEIIDNIEVAFVKYKFKNTEFERNILRVIENAAICNTNAFIDRFGNKLPISDLSTGTKAALLIHANPDKLVDTIECGLNALSSILSFCKAGNVLMHDYQTHLPYVDDVNPIIDVCLDKYRFDNLDRLCDYLCNERPFAPDMSGGIYDV